MMMRADENYTAVEGCSAEELLACFNADDYDACIAKCADEPETPEEPTNPGYAKVTTKAASTQTVALNAVEKKIGTVTLTAGENDTTVTALEITKSGLGDPDDILSIQLMKNGEYVTTASDGLTSKRTATMRFSPKLVIKAGKSETFDVVVSLSGANANGQHDFSVTAVTVANGDFGGTPAKLGSLVTTNYLVSTTKVALEGANPVNAGDENVELVRINVTPKAEATVSSITLTSSEDELNKKFSNVKAYIDDEVVGTVTVNDETITIDSLNQNVKMNKKLEITLKGDVIYVGPSLEDDDALIFYMEANHVNATETNTNERMASNEIKKADGAALEVAGIDLTLKNLVKKTQRVTPGTDDVVLMDLELSAGADLQITDYELDLGEFPFAQFDESKVTLYIDGIDYTIKAGTETSWSSKKDYFSINAGEKISIQLKGDVVDFSCTTETVDEEEVEVCPEFTDIDGLEFTINTVKNLETNKEIEDVDESATSHATTFVSGKPVVKKTNKDSSNLLKEGETSVVLGFSVKASDEKITLKELTFAIPSANLTEVALYKSGSSKAIVKLDEDDTTERGDSISLSVSQAINADATENYILKATLADGVVEDLGTNINFALTAIEYTTASNSEATDYDGDLSKVTASYQIASDEPTFKLTKNGNKIIVEVTNNSEYDIHGARFAIKVIGKFVDGNDLLASALVKAEDGTATWHVNDEDGDLIETAMASYASNMADVELELDIDARGTETFEIEMVEKTAIESDYYTVEEKLMGFTYFDDNAAEGHQESHGIVAKYNGGSNLFATYGD